MTWLKWLIAAFALLAGLIPAIYETLKRDVHIDEIARHAAVFKKLHDGFRQAATVTALGPWQDFKAEFDGLMGRMDAARSTSLTPPEHCLEAARRKVAADHYKVDADAATAANTPQRGSKKV